MDSWITPIELTSEESELAVQAHETLDELVETSWLKPGKQKEASQTSMHDSQLEHAQSAW